MLRHEKCLSLEKSKPMLKLQNHKKRICRKLTCIVTASSSAAPSYTTSTNQYGAIEKREMERAVRAFHQFRVRGVSFEGRQDQVKSLDRGQAVMLIHEPSNPYDKNAIAIKLLNGKQLGYVPKDINTQPPFRRFEDFAHIQSSGPVSTEPDLHGASVIQQPLLEPLIAQAVPPELKESFFSAENFLPKSTWKDISTRILEKRNGSCGISFGNKEPLVVVPVWQEDEDQKKFVLKGFRGISELLAKAQEVFLEKKTPENESLWTFQAMNGWTSSEALDYRGYKKALQEQRENSDWSLDLSILEKNGIQTSKSVK